jgi:GT2 family glycosyltransferase
LSNSSANEQPITWNEVGVVAIGRNEGERLLGCLTSVRSKAGKVVYVDSGSTDGSAAAAENLGAFVVRLNLDQPFTAARARNEGFAALRAIRPDIGFVQFIDGDCLLNQHWLETAIPFVEPRKDLALVCGRRRERNPEGSIYNRLADIEWNTPVGEALACGGDSLVRVEAFEAVGGFRSRLIAGEEPELCVRLREKGWKIWRVDAEMTLHDMAMTRFSQWWIRAVRAGYAFAEVSQLHWTSPFGIWRRETLRVVVWGGVVPLAICLGAIIHPAALAAVLVYPLQICRIAFARGPASAESWIYASFMTLAKFAEFQGFVKFHLHRWRRVAVTLIEYK